MRHELTENVHDLALRPALFARAGVESDYFGTLKKLDRAHCALVDVESALFDAGADEAQQDQVYTARWRVRERMRRMILAPAFSDDPIERYRALEFVAGVDGVVSPIMLHAARAFADAAERALAMQAAEG